LLAQKIVSIYYSEDDAKKASEEFVNLFKKKEIPDDIPEYKLNGDNKLADVLVAARLCETKGEAKRLIQGGGVKLDGNKLDDPALELSLAQGEVLQAGKR
jgi:tyrosyl-tRNA synthetase